MKTKSSYRIALRGHLTLSFLSSLCLLLILGRLHSPTPLADADTGRQIDLAGSVCDQTLIQHSSPISIIVQCELKETPPCGNADHFLQDVPGIKSIKSYKHIAAVSMSATTAGIQHICRLPGVRFAGRDPIASLHLENSVPFIGADKVHRRGITGVGTRIAVTDSGVDARHPDLRHAIVDELCFQTPCGPESHPARDSTGHGTRVTGVIASRGRVASVGVAPGAEIAAFRVWSHTGSLSSVLSALDVIIDRDDIDIVNASWGYGPFSAPCDDPISPLYIPLVEAVQQIIATGKVFVASTGNDKREGAMTMPACIEGVISVAATDDSNSAAATYANISSLTTIMAPGSVRSSAIGGDASLSIGTSLAAPHISGALALMREVAPWASGTTLVDVMHSTAQHPYKRYADSTVGTLDIDEAITLLEGLTPTATSRPAPNPSPTPTVTATRTATLSAQTPTPQPPTAPPSATPTASEEVTTVPARQPIYLPAAMR